MPHADIGFIGLAVMGQNLVLNMERNGYAVAVYNRTAARTEEFLARHPDRNLQRATTLRELADRVRTPRTIMIMVQAGAGVDAVLRALQACLAPGDLIIDGGNSHFKDTERRARQLEARGLEFMGAGVSGGEEGALRGPSIMPGGARAAYARVRDVFTAISAKAPEDGAPCVAYMGPAGAGHYVKMVHNAIEYGDMQLIAETYDILRQGLGMDNAELAATFAAWNDSELDSFLIDITARIFRTPDALTAQALVDMVLDTAAQKGTGKWSSQDALELGAPVPTINAAVVGRVLSSLKEERVQAAAQLPSGATPAFAGDRNQWTDDVKASLYAGKISAYAQGLALLRFASAEYGYALPLGEIASVWRAGCIIRARFLNRIAEAFRRDAALPNLLLDPEFKRAVSARLPAWRRVVSAAVQAGIPVLGLGASLAYYDAYRSARLPANLIQAQRDFFGAHTYQRVDRAGTFHSDWG